MMTAAVRGLVWALLSAVMWSGMYALGRALMADRAIDPVSLSWLRFASAGVLLLLIGLLRRGRRMFAVRRRDWLPLIGQGILGAGGTSIFVFWAQETATAVESSMLEAVIPIMIFLGGVVTGEKVSRSQLCGIGLSTVGCLLVVQVIQVRGLMLERLDFGMLLIVIAGICWAAYVVWGRKLARRLDGFIYTTWSFLGGAAVLTIVEAAHWHDIVLPVHLHDWLLVVAMILIPTVGAFIAWNQAERLINLNLLNMSQYIIGPLAVFWAWLFLKESVSGLQILGVLLILGGIGLGPDSLRYYRRLYMRFRQQQLPDGRRRQLEADVQPVPDPGVGSGDDAARQQDDGVGAGTADH